MVTKTLAVTYVSLQELRDALRSSFQAHGLDIDDYYFELRGNELLGVASVFVLESSPADAWTLADVVREDLYFLSKGSKILQHMISQYIAELTDTRKYGDKAWPKTDYIVTAE